MKLVGCVVASILVLSGGRNVAVEFAVSATKVLIDAEDPVSVLAKVGKLGSLVMSGLEKVDPAKVDDFAIEALRRWAISVAQNKDGTGFKMLMDQGGSSTADSLVVKVSQIPVISKFEQMTTGQWAQTMKSRGGENKVIADLIEELGLNKEQLVTRLVDKDGDLRARLLLVREDLTSQLMTNLAGALTVSHFLVLKFQFSAVRESGVNLNDLAEELESFQAKYVDNKEFKRLYTEIKFLKFAQMDLNQLAKKAAKEFSTNQVIKAKALGSAGLSFAQMVRAGYAIYKMPGCFSFPPEWKCAPNMIIFVSNLVLMGGSADLWFKASKNVEGVRELHANLSATAQEMQEKHCSSKFEGQQQCVIQQQSDLPDWWTVLAEAPRETFSNFLGFA